jgi:Lon protease-like protein
MTMTIDVPRSALQDLAVFPLPNAVLFPGAILPLHVFEPRYREMTRDVLDSTRMLAIARLRPGYEHDYYGRPPMFSTAGIGYVIGSDELPNGRYNLLVRGIGRVSVDNELPPDKSYRRVQARPPLTPARGARRATSAAGRSVCPARRSPD